MPDGNGDERGTGTDYSTTKEQLMDRRRLLQLTGVGIVTAGVASQAAGAASQLPHTITFDGSGTTSTADYEFGVSEAVEAHGDVGALESDDSIDGTSVVGQVDGDSDAYRFSGTLTHLDVGGQVSVSINYGDTTATGPDRLEILTPADGAVEYTFTCDDRIEKVTDAGDRSAEDNDVIAENDGTWTATGLTGNGYGDTFDVHGDVTSFEPTSGSFTLLLNGEERTVADLTGQQSGGDDSTDDGDTDDGTSHTLEIFSEGSIQYTLSTTEEITKDLDAGDMSAESDNDHVEQTDDGSWTATGFTGNGYGDTFEFRGEVLDFQPRTGQFTLYLDGQEITPEELVGEEQSTHRIEIVTPEDGAVEYTFETSGEAEKVLDAGDNSAEADNDVISHNDDGTCTVTGLTGNGYGDTFDFRGEVTDFDPLKGEFGLYVNGQQITPWELIGVEEPEEEQQSSGAVEGGPIGGGQGYERTVSREEADTVVRSRSELSNALSSAAYGDIVFVSGDEELAMGSRTIDIPSGVTLASNRGVDGAPGALLETADEDAKCFHMHGSARLTGVRLKGPRPGGDTGADETGGGVSIYGNCEVDNCDIWGFSYAGIGIDSGDEAHIHHNTLRENTMYGYGYGVTALSGHPIIEYNYFNWNRHSIASSGSHHGYTARYNHFGPDMTDTPIDVHEPGCVRVEVYNNTVEGVVPNTGRFAGDDHQSVQIRGTPDEVATIHDNWFYNPNPPGDSPDGWSDDSAIIQPLNDEWTNVEWANNQYGESEPSADIGHPR